MDLSLTEVALIIGMSTTMQVEVDPGEIACMARNVYFEARGETDLGRQAVAYTTLNRVASPRYPDTICDVVAEDRGPEDWDCQFSWYCDGKSDVPSNHGAYVKSLAISIEAMTGRLENPVPGATHFYAPGLTTPNWSFEFAEIAIIGGHRFMQE